MHVPAYLALSRHHVFYFRWPVPAFLHPQGKARHIRLSLGTRDPKEALRLAKHLEYHAMAIQGKLAVGMDYVEVQRILRDYFSKLLARRKEAIDKEGSLDAIEVASLQNTAGFLEQAISEGMDDFHPIEELDDMLARFPINKMPDLL